MLCIQNAKKKMFDKNVKSANFHARISKIKILTDYTKKLCCINIFIIFL